MKKFEDIRYSSAHVRCVLDLYLPDAENVKNGRVPVAVWYHGGGLVNGDKNGKSGLAAELASAGIATAAVRYRLYPEAKYPEFVEDAAAAAAWVFENYDGYLRDNYEGVGNGGIFIGGESAGAYLSMMLCFDKRYLAKHGIDSADAAGYLHCSGQTTAHFNVLKERGVDSRRVIVDESAPVYFVGLESRLAPMLFLVSDNDMFNRLEQNRLIFRTLQHFGLAETAELHELSGKHCEFCSKREPDGMTELYHLSSEFIAKYVK